MANYYATARSNYFQVKDAEAFKKEMEECFPDIKIDDQEDGFFALFPMDMDSGGWPVCYYDPEDGEFDEDITVEGVVANHLKEGSIAVFMEAGAEKLRYVNGSAIAVNHLGDICQVHLNEIYAKAAKEFGVPEADITRAEY